MPEVQRQDNRPSTRRGVVSRVRKGLYQERLGETRFRGEKEMNDTEKRAYQREYRNRPEVREKLRKQSLEYSRRPEVKEQHRAYNNRPDVRAHRKVYVTAYKQRPDILAKRKYPCDRNCMDCKGLFIAIHPRHLRCVPCRKKHRREYLKEFDRKRTSRYVKKERKNKITPELLEQITALRRNGKTYTEITNETGLERHTLSKYLFNVLGVTWSRWTEGENQFLKEQFPCSSKERVINELPNRTWFAIVAQAEKLGLSRARITNIKIVTLSLSDRDRGYLAGLFDGEGSISVGWTKTGVLVAELSVTNTNRDVLEYVKELVGGGTIRGDRRRGERKLAYKFSISKKGHVYGILKELLPEVIIKRDVIGLTVELLDKFFRIYTINERWTGVQYHSEIAPLVKQIKMLNLKGRKGEKLQQQWRLQRKRRSE